MTAALPRLRSLPVDCLKDTQRSRLPIALSAAAMLCGDNFVLLSSQMKSASTAELKPRPYKQVARARSQEQTRDALLEAAIDELCDGRFPRMSLEAISARAGVTKPTLLRHFGSKEGLLIQALTRASSRILDQRWSTPVGDIEGTIENLIGHYEAWGERSLRIGAWEEDGPAVLSGISRMARQVHYDWIDHAFNGWLEPLDAAARARRRAALIAICDVHTWRLLFHDLKLERSEVRATLIEMVQRTVAESQ
jgi:AcrR family transcriptional regulator